MAMVSPVTAGDALDGLIAEQEAALIARTTCSHELHAEALHHLPGGVASSWQDAPPCPVFLERGAGSRVWDVDGTEYVDLHAGFGTMIAGHAHPALVAAISSGWRPGRTSPSRCPTSSRSPPSWRAASGSRCGGSPTPGRRRRSPRSTSSGPSPADRHHQGRGQLPRPPRRRPSVRLSRPRQRRAGGSAASGRRARRGRPGHRRGRRTSCRSVSSTRCAACCSTIPARSRR